MPQLHAPDFMKKLKLLEQYAEFKNIAQIALEIGVKEETLRSWTKDHGVRVEGKISRFGRDPVIKLFSAHLPHLSVKQVIELLEGPYDDMASAFFLKGLSSLTMLINSEAKREGVKLCVDCGGPSKDERKAMFSHKKAQQGADQVDDRNVIRDVAVATVKMRPVFGPTEFVPIGMNFRLEFPIFHRAKYYVGLQKTSQAWAVFAAAPVTKGDIVHMPAPDERDALLMMSEDHDVGQSCFTLIQSSKPFPDFLHVNLRDGIPLSRTDLGFLQRHIQETPKADRKLNAIDIEFFKA